MVRRIWVGLAREMQVPAVWLPAPSFGPSPGDAIRSPQPASQETKSHFVSSEPGSRGRANARGGQKWGPGDTGARVGEGLGYRRRAWEGKSVTTVARVGGESFTADARAGRRRGFPLSLAL